MRFSMRSMGYDRIRCAYTYFETGIIKLGCTCGHMMDIKEEWIGVNFNGTS